MRYLLLLYGDEAAEAALSREDRRAIMEAHGAFTARLREAGAYLDGDALASGAKVVRRDGQLVTDGPFAETKEQLGGFYLLECAGTDEALAWAQQVPMSPGLVVEIRPLTGA